MQNTVGRTTFSGARGDSPRPQWVHIQEADDTAKSVSLCPCLRSLNVVLLPVVVDEVVYFYGFADPLAVATFV